MKYIRLTNSTKRSLVDDGDYEALIRYSWRLTNKGYPSRTTTVAGTGQVRRTERYTMHRVIMNVPKGVQIDHANGNPLDNRRSNLRISTQSQNRANSRKMKNCVSRFKGVRRHKGRKEWITRITTPAKKDKYIGFFMDERHAALAYDLWAVDLHGEFARTNFPVVSSSGLRGTGRGQQ